MRRAALIGLRLAANVALVVLAAYAVSQVVHVASTDDLNFLIWLLAGAMLHDAVLLPVYTLVDVAGRFVLAENGLRRIPLVNHVRVPVIIAGVLFLVDAPGILGKNTGTFARTSGRQLAVDPLQAWLWITAALFALSSMVYAVRVVRLRRAEPLG